jgi:Na+/H+ antiporter NhaD/arsenite permease-like protein
MELWLTLICFAITYTGLALGRLPWLRIDRAGIGLVGATLVLSTGLLHFDDAVKSIDFNTIALLLGMMILVGFLHRANFFSALAQWVLERVKTPHGLLATTMLLSGSLSAILVNDVVCLALTPLVANLARSQRLDARPHLIGLALASNIGSVATLTGNPQNMMIGGFSGISYLRFTEKLAPIAVLSMIVAYFLTVWIFRTALRKPKVATQSDHDSTVALQPENGRRSMHQSQRLLLFKSLGVTLIAMILFFAGLPMAIVALGAASVLLLGRAKPDKVYQRVDWGLLVMFASLFVVVHAFEVHVLARCHIHEWTILQESPVGLLSAVSGALSNIVSNVPAVLLFKPIVLAMPVNVQEVAWLALAMSSTLAGNLTVLGSVANLIVVEGAKREGVNITFTDYAKVGVPVTILTMLVGIFWLRLIPC